MRDLGVETVLGGIELYFFEGIIVEGHFSLMQYSRSMQAVTIHKHLPRDDTLGQGALRYMAPTTQHRSL